MTDHSSWATLTVAFRPTPSQRQRIERDALAAIADAMESMASMLAEEPGVGGVENRDATHSDVDWPVMVVYTTPGSLEELEGQTRRLADSLNLSCDYRGETHVGDAWKDAWKRHYRPIDIGSTLRLRPSWIERTEDRPPHELVLDPGRAFGTGLHATTRLCLDQLVAGHENGWALTSVLDVGCGSGILGLAAARLNPKAAVTCIDNDPEATETTRENLELNGIEAGRFEVVTGVLDEVDPAQRDLVFANIRPEVLIPNAEALLARTGDTLILSGILDIEADPIREAFRAPAEAAGFAEADTHQREGWVAIVYRKQP